MQPFPDYGFKLVVLQELLENGSFTTALNRLKTEPHIAVRLSGQEAYGEVIEEMDHFFRNIQITPEDLSKVTELCFDGGNDIYHLIRPFWSGETDEFDIHSVDGFECLSNLKKVLFCSMIQEDQLQRLSSSGVTVE